MKQAGRKTRHLWTLASAWQIKEVEHYSKVVCSIYKEDYANFCDYFVDQGGDLEADMNNANSLVAYHHELYNEQLESLDNMNMQLDRLKEVM